MQIVFRRMRRKLSHPRHHCRAFPWDLRCDLCSENDINHLEIFIKIYVVVARVKRFGSALMCEKSGLIRINYDACSGRRSEHKSLITFFIMMQLNTS